MFDFPLSMMMVLKPLSTMMVLKLLKMKMMTRIYCKGILILCLLILWCFLEGVMF